MGTFSEARVTMEFDPLPEGMKDFPEKLDEYINDNYPGSAVELYDFTCDEGGVEFKMSSPRIPNMEWQIDMVVECLRHHKLVPEEVSIDVMEQSHLTTFMEKESFETE